MNYTHLIDPELKSIAKRVPYNKFLIKTANIYQMLAFALTGISREISCKRIIIRENGRLPLKVVIYEPIGIAVDSSGVAIAAAICNAYEKEALPIPCAQMLIYPVTDASMSTKSIKLYSDTPLWNSQNNKKMWEFYLKNVTGENIRNASPMQNVLPHKLPDTYIETAE